MPGSPTAAAGSSSGPSPGDTITIKVKTMQPATHEVAVPSNVS